MVNNMKYEIKLFLLKTLSLIPSRLLMDLSCFLWDCIKCKFTAFILSAMIYNSKKTRQKFNNVFISDMQDSNNNFVSIIIPTYNRAKSLERLLQSLSKQIFEYSYFEIIVINNGSDDNTHEICNQYSSLIGNFKEICEHKPGLLAARNRGVRESCGNILIFCDDDIEPDIGWLSAIYSIMLSRQDVMLLGGNNRGNFEISPPQFISDLWITDSNGIRINSHYSLIEGILQGMIAPHHSYVMGCNFTVRREVVYNACGFGPDCMPCMLWQGDGENRVGEVAQSMGTVWLDPRVSVTHHMPQSRISRDYLKKRNLYFLISNMYTSLRNGLIPPYQPAEAQTYLDAVVKLPELRDWLTKPDYWNEELPPSVDCPQIKQLLQRHGW